MGHLFHLSVICGFHYHKHTHTHTVVYFDTSLLPVILTRATNLYKSATQNSPKHLHYFLLFEHLPSCIRKLQSLFK